MYQVHKADDLQETEVMQETVKRKSNVLLIIILCVIIAILAIGGGYAYNKFVKNAQNKGVSIVELDSLDALRAISRDEFISASDRLYKVGDDYYGYFPSTGKLELVSTVKDYDKMSLTLLDGMLGDVQSAATNTTDDISKATNVSDLFGSTLAERTQYVQYELDNCNANLLLTSNDSGLLSYKTKLESELMQLVAYQAVSAEQLQFFLQCLGTEEADKVLAEKISKLLDQQFVQLVNSYNISGGTVGKEELEKVLQSQNEAIQTLTEKYNTIEKTLVEKRVALDTGSSALSESDIQTVINNLDVYVDKYLADYSKQVTALETKLSALEQLYGSMGALDTSESDGTVDNAALLAIKNQYVQLRNEQTALQERVTYLEGVVGSAAKVESTPTTNSDDGVSAALQSELDKQKAQYEAISDILNNSDLENIGKLAEEQTKIQETINQLEEALKAADELINSEQTEAREELERSLQELISQTSDNQDELRKQLEDELRDKLNASDEDLKNKYDSTQEALKTLEEASENGISETRKDLTDALETLRQNSSDELAALNAEIQNAINALNDDLLEKYTEVTRDIRDINTQIEEMLQVQEDYGIRIETLETGLSDATDRIGTLETGLEDTQDALKALTERVKVLEENPYILPKATKSILGGVMVDGDTIEVDPDGTLHVLVSYNTLDEFYPIGTTYPTVSGPKKRIKDYVIQVKEDHITTQTVTTVKDSAIVQIDEKVIPAVTEQGYLLTLTSHTSVSGSVTTDDGVTHPVTPSDNTNTYTVGPMTTAAYLEYKAQYPDWPVLAHGSTGGGGYRPDGSYVASPSVSYCTEVIDVVLTTIITTPEEREPILGERWRYTAINPFTNVVYVTDYIYESKAQTPSTHTFTGSRYDYSYVGSNRLNNVQLQKLYDKGIITNVSNQQTYLKQLYDKYFKSGSNKYLYCGIPTIPV